MTSSFMLIGSATLSWPETSSTALLSVCTRPPACTAICPPCDIVSDPDWNSTEPPVVISMRDRSSLSESVPTSLSCGLVALGALSRSTFSEADCAISSLRWESSAVTLLLSGLTAVTLPGASVITAEVSAVSVSRCTVPRSFTDVVATAIPA